MEDLINKLSVLTTIPDRNLVKLLDKSYLVISDAIVDAMLKGENVVEIDIGLGVLYIQILENSLKYKIIPSKKLEAVVKTTVINKKNMLEDTLETSLVNRIVKTYKDFI